MRVREPICVLMGGLPDLIQTVLCDVLADQPDIEIVADGSSTDEIAEEARSTDPDVIVVGTSDHALLRTCRTLALASHSPVVRVGLDGREVVVYLHNLSPNGFVKVIRACVPQAESPRPRAAKEFSEGDC